MYEFTTKVNEFFQNVDKTVNQLNNNSIYLSIYLLTNISYFLTKKTKTLPFANRPIVKMKPILLFSSILFRMNFLTTSGVSMSNNMDLLFVSAFKIICFNSFADLLNMKQFNI